MLLGGEDNEIIIESWRGYWIDNDKNCCFGQGKQAAIQEVSASFFRD